MRRLVCLACGDRLTLTGPTTCACGRSAARPDGDGWAYTGPAVLALAVHEHDRARERVVRVPDDDDIRRAQVDPLL